MTFVPPSSHGGISTGTAFPASPATSDLFWRTDLNMLFYYTGTQWLSATLYRSVASLTASTIAVTTAAPWAVPALDLDMYLVAFEVAQFVVTTNNGTNFWTTQLAKIDAANTPTSIGAGVSTAAVAANTWLTTSVAIGAALGGSATYKAIRVASTPTLAPGVLAMGCSLSYRLIAT